MQYQWTDWITHIPGQELPIGVYGIFEFHGLVDGVLKVRTKEGMLDRSHKGHPCWRATTPGVGLYARITRYKLRSVADEAEVSSAKLIDDRTVITTSA